MVYGANGYTGRLILDLCRERSITPVVAGRSEAKIVPLADSFGFPHAIFDLDDAAAFDAALENVDALLLAAGPFSATSAPAVDACIRNGKHYLDITGEIEVFEAVFARSEDAATAGVALMPGVGFDVVPTDCLAASLARALPSATHLEMAFAGSGGASPGTLKTMIEGIPEGGRIRREGAIVEVPTAYASRAIPFRDRTREAATIPWGDVSTAFYSTGIPNIMVYLALPQGAQRGMRLLGKMGGLVGTKPVQAALKGLVGFTVKGPSDDVRERSRMQLWGEARDAEGGRVEMTLATCEGYKLTALTAVEASVRACRGVAGKGALTPSMAFGPDFVTGFPGCTMESPGAP